MIFQKLKMENYTGDSSTGQRWLHKSRGELITRDEEIPCSTLVPGAVYWDESTHRKVMVGERIFRHPNNERVEGRNVAWREEIMISVPGELRIYMRDIPVEDRRVTLMQDPLHRSSLAHMPMGYGDKPPLTSYQICEE